ncbi:hypothetical protein [Archaeoglobus sp.]
MQLRYYSPLYNKEEHFEVIKLLEKIRSEHGIEYEEIVVEERDWYPKKKQMSEVYVYEYHIKPYSRLIVSNRNKLIERGERGLDLYDDTVSRLFKSRPGNVYVAGTVAVVDNEVVLLVVKGYDEVSTFLRALLREGKSLLSILERGKVKTTVKFEEREDIIKRLLVDGLSKNFDYVFMDVKYNAVIGYEDIFIMFTPDADIIAVDEKKERIIGIEVKGYRVKGGRTEKASVYEAIGEAMMYLVNPYMKYRGEWIDGGIFDEVWLCYPYKRDFEEFKKVMELTPIGLISAYEGVVKRADPNPFVSEKAKKVFLNSLGSFVSYIRGGKKARNLL